MRKIRLIIIFYIFCFIPSLAFAEKCNNFKDILMSLNSASYCEGQVIYKGGAVDTDANGKRVIVNDLSCAVVKGLFSNVVNGDNNLFSVLMMSISFIIYYVAFVFFVYFIFKLIFNMAATGSFLSGAENNTVFVRIILGVTLLFPMNNSNSLFIHHVVYAVINTSISLANQIEYQYFSNKEVNDSYKVNSDISEAEEKCDSHQPNGWANGLYNYSFNILGEVFSNKKISINNLKDKAQDLTRSVTGVIIGNISIQTLAGLLLSVFSEYGLPFNALTAVSESMMDIYLMFFTLTGWIPVLIFLIGIPLISLFTFFSIFLGWLYSCIELMFLAPVICLGLMWPFSGGESFLGKILPAIYSALRVLIIPALALISYLLVIPILSYVFDIFLGYSGFKDYLKDFDYYLTGVGLPDFTPIDLQGRIQFLVYTTIIYAIILKAFLFIRIILNNVLRYLGDSSGSSIDSFAVGDSFQNLLNEIASYVKNPVKHERPK